MSIIPLIIKSKTFGDVKITKEDIISIMKKDDSNDTDFDCKNIVISPSLRRICLNEDSNSLENISDNIWHSLIYIGGYASYSLIKKLKCEYCKIFLTENIEDKTLDSTLITANDRGGLSYPSEDVATCSAYTYITLENLLKREDIYLKEQHQRNILIKLTIETICDQDKNLFLGHECTQHATSGLINSVIKSTANILLKNYSKKCNDVATTKNMPVVKRFKPTV